MTITEHLLIKNYAMQKVYLMRITELLCGISEKLENLQEEPQGLMWALLAPDIDGIIGSLEQEILALKPDDTHLSILHGIPPKIIDNWINKAEKKILFPDQEDFFKEDNS